jgi:branched-chain amino acid transport system permease protein
MGEPEPTSLWAVTSALIERGSGPTGPPSLGHRRVVATVAILASVLVAIVAVSTAGAAHAQPVPTASDAPAPSTPDGSDAPATDGLAIIGMLSSSSGPIAGVKVTVAQDGTAVGEAVSGEDGAFRVSVPGSGTYQVAIDPATFPEGVTLAEGASGSLDRVVVFEGRDKVLPFNLRRTTDAAETSGPSLVDQLVNALVQGVRYGLVIALCAVGLTLIYGTTGLVNFAHGELVTFGALIAWWASSGDAVHLPLILAAVIGFVATGVFGGLQDATIWQPLRRRRAGNVSTIVISIGLSIFLRNIYLVIFDGNPRAYAQFATQSVVDLGPVHIQPKELVSILVCIVALLATGALLRFTRLGTAVRAVSDEPDLARSSGVDVRRVILAVWVGGAALAGLGGTMLGLTEGVQWNMGFRILLYMFAAAVLGGLGSPIGAMLGGLTLGLVAEVGSIWIPSDFKFVMSLGALVVVLLIRPQGFFGLKERVG